MGRIYTFILAALLVAALPWVTQGQVHLQDFSRVDECALSTPAVAAHDLNTLAHHLKNCTTTDYQRARIIFRWITENIELDGFAVKYGRTNVNNQKADVVLKRRKTDAQGFANLFAELAVRMELETQNIPGYIRRNFDSDKKFKLAAKPDHVWNVVKLAGKWHLIDACAGAGFLTFQYQFVKKFEPAYFLTAPETFALDHLPTEPQWQLLEQPIDAKAFVRQPRYLPYPFLVLKKPRVANLKRGVKYEFELEAPYILSARVILLGQKRSFLNIQKNGDRYKATLTFDGSTKAVELALEISPGAYQTVAEYKIK